jgi:hypothetical protein
MTAKEYLSQLQINRVRIEIMQEQRQMLLDMATSITAPINDVHVQTSSSPDRMANAVIRAADKEKEINQEMNNLVVKEEQIINEIQSLHNVKQVQLLYKVYVQFKTIKIAACEIGVSYYYALELHKKALKAFEELHADILNGVK